ncbi:hypothetical protein [Streptomyces sp. CC210A]|uniref:hypothetical protein n=1 Tax=Streptomyces sp. CC210A TaxID=2898184 RepID=UPI0035A866A4
MESPPAVVDESALTRERVDGLADAGLLPLRTRRIAVQSALGGVLVSLAAMAAAAVGLLPPAAGALLQEGVDVAVVLNTLHADRAARPSLTPDAESLSCRTSSTPYGTPPPSSPAPRVRRCWRQWKRRSDC